MYGLGDDFFRTVPVFGTLWARAGGVPAHPEHAYRLLREQSQLVLVFPDGTKGSGKLYRERYQLRRFGRGGFVESAMRAGVPIVSSSPASSSLRFNRIGSREARIREVSPSPYSSGGSWRRSPLS